MNFYFFFNFSSCLINDNFYIVPHLEIEPEFWI